MLPSQYHLTLAASPFTPSVTITKPSYFPPSRIFRQGATRRVGERRGGEGGEAVMAAGGSGLGTGGGTGVDIGTEDEPGMGTAWGVEAGAGGSWEGGRGEGGRRSTGGCRRGALQPGRGRTLSMVQVGFFISICAIWIPLKKVDLSAALLGGVGEGGLGKGKGMGKGLIFFWALGYKTYELHSVTQYLVLNT